MSSKEEKKYRGKPDMGYKLLKAYIGLFHNKFYYKKVYWLQTEKIPRDVPLVVVSNHQNGLNDPLGVIFSMKRRKKRKVRFIARADVFLPAVKNILSWLGILPAYRNDHQGEGSAAKNRFMLAEAEDELNLNGTVGIYPESGHQDIRWLGRFSPGYLHIIFEAARLSDFQKEMYVIPSCNHYSNYFLFRERMLVKYGEPITLSPYYELYKQSPRQAQVEVNEKIKESVAEIMLNITDLDNYDAIDFLRDTYGRGYARKNGYDPENLGDKLMADKQFFASLEIEKAKDARKVQNVYDDTIVLKNAIGEYRINDRDFDRKLSLFGMIFKGLGLLLLYPLYLVACIPNYLVYIAPRLMTRKNADAMLHGGINLAVSALVTMPVSYILTFFLTRWISGSWLIAAGHFVLLPFLAVFAWNYSRWFVRWKQGLRFNKAKRKGRVGELRDIRSRIYAVLNSILG